MSRSVLRLPALTLSLAGFAQFASPQSIPLSTSGSPAIAAELARALLSAKRIYVESFGGDNISKSLQAMIADAVGNSKRFIVTENREKADLFLKGAAVEKTAEEFHSLGSSTTVAGAAGGGSSHISGHAGASSATVSGSSQGGFMARKLGISDDQASIETVNDARVAVRLVSRDGDVVWSTTQESRGGKFKGATADAADKVVKQLLRDLSKLEAQRPSQ